MPAMDHSSTNGTFDPARRRLCPDGACVGVIGPDGICRECGRTETAAAAGETAAVSMSANGAAASEPDQDAFATVEPTEGAEASAASVTGDFDPTRRLCDDGSCVGVVGEDGMCRVCGRRSE